jgi:hypothetical protein
LRAGRELPAVERNVFGSAFGFDFSDVRVHTGAEAAESARSVGARAYTFGRDVVFDTGQWAPHTFAGRQLITHELTHVVQQARAGRPRLQRWKYDASDTCLAAGVRRAKKLLRANWSKAAKAYAKWGGKLMDFIADGTGPEVIFKYKGPQCGFSWKSASGEDLITIPKGVRSCCFKCGNRGESVKKLLGFTLIHETAHWCAATHKKDTTIEHGDDVEKAIFGGIHVMENCTLKKVSSYSGKPCYSCPGVNDK